MEETLWLIMAMGGVVLLAAGAFFAVRGTWNMYEKLSAAGESSSASARELENLQVQQSRIEANIERLSSPRGVEGELRERYGLAKPGEGVIQVVESQSSVVPAGSPQSDSVLGRVLHTLLPW